MNLWGILVGEVPKQEEIAVIMIPTTGPALLKRNTIEIGINRMAHNFYLIECHPDITVASKDTTQVADILFFALLVVLNLLRSKALCMSCGDDLTCDNQCIITEYLVEESF